MDVELLSIYLLNLLVVAGMFIVTIYRAWIERQELKAKQQIEILKEVLEREKSTIRELSGEEFIDMLRTILEN